MQIEEILIIKNGSESYGISTEDINQISRVPSIMPLPLRPSGTRGLCGVGGNIVAMIDLNLLLDLPEVDMDASASRLISLNESYSSNALLVSEIYNTVYIEEKNIDYIENKDDPVIAIYKYKDSLVQILSLDLLIAKINKIDLKSKDVYNGKPKDIKVVEEDTSRFLVFAMNNEQFALDIDFLREIILADVKYTDIAGSSSELLGLITLREELVAVMDLRKYYGFKSEKSDKNRILIASHNGNNIGLLVDEIIDIKGILNKDIEYIESKSSGAQISGVIHDDKNLISFFDKEVIENIFKDNEAYIESKDKVVEENLSSEESVELIVFKLGSKEYSFDAEYVAEIIDIMKSTKVAYSNDDIDGIINIRGQIVPLVSLYDKLNIKSTIDENSKIIVCHVNDYKVGVAVDSISDILSVNPSDIKEQDDETFKNVLHLDNGKRLVLSMDISSIIEDKES
jgi:purine-binding chemotaxis protein CheW